MSLPDESRGAGMPLSDSRPIMSIHCRDSLSCKSFGLLAPRRYQCVREPHNGAQQERFDHPRRHRRSPPFLYRDPVVCGQHHPDCHASTLSGDCFLQLVIVIILSKHDAVSVMTRKECEQ